MQTFKESIPSNKEKLLEQLTNPVFFPSIQTEANN